jgi:hypothetical protein
LRKYYLKLPGALIVVVVVQAVAVSVALPHAPGLAAALASLFLGTHHLLFAPLSVVLIGAAFGVVSLISVVLHVIIILSVGVMRSSYRLMQPSKLVS